MVKVVEAEVAGKEPAVGGGALMPMDTGALSAVVRSEIDIQIATAKAYPRSVTKFRSEVEAMATLTEDIAAGCFYAIERGGKVIEGPSARFGEIVLSAWGNCRAGGRPMSEGNEFVTAQGFFFDVERNVVVVREVQRRITDRQNRRYSPDMVAVTMNAAISIAQRNAEFAGIPQGFWHDIYLKARSAAIGDMKTLATKRADMIVYFGKMGVNQDAILAKLDKKGIEDIGLDELALLKGIVNALKDGDISSIEEAFPVIAEKKEEKKGTAGLKEKVAGKKGTPEKEPPKEGAQAVPGPTASTPQSEPFPAGEDGKEAPPPAPQTAGGTPPKPPELPKTAEEAAKILRTAKAPDELDALWKKNVFENKALNTGDKTTLSFVYQELFAKLNNPK